MEMGEVVRVERGGRETGDRDTLGQGWGWGSGGWGGRGIDGGGNEEER